MIFQYSAIGNYFRREINWIEPTIYRTIYGVINLTLISNSLFQQFQSKAVRLIKVNLVKVNLILH